MAFLVVFGGSWRRLANIRGYWWFLAVLGSWLFSGSWGFLVVLGCFVWLIVVLGGNIRNPYAIYNQHEPLRTSKTNHESI